MRNRRLRFLREAKASAALEHPNIGAIHEIAEAPDGQMFIVMGYYEGDTLKQKIQQGPLAAKEAVDIASQIACRAELTRIAETSCTGTSSRATSW